MTDRVKDKNILKKSGERFGVNAIGFQGVGTASAILFNDKNNANNFAIGLAKYQTVRITNPKAIELIEKAINNPNLDITNIKLELLYDALEEYEYEKTHCDEMVTQRDDLQKAIDDLQMALDEIRGEMLRIFNEGFDQINENFKITFKELFGGGKAELQIDYEEEEDPLNAGVEIVACPPGKKLTKISLLSGGERALTAIAILFAILKSRPMPFCILDEIEAALDDANVDRFASYLKHFSEETQFIVITHRKPTMNQADSLFGVTMQEKGVSKIVSVKLAEVESRLGAGTVE